ncbi:hypothetical protein [Sulfurimonas sp.]|uniref:hypothetical protein n=1 Tax=Sulfurimonas sp. TaxID=2022749 RepID=UPI0026286B99|nr:hypothetical protein [Sulfurimonas sp.]MCW8894964.1 hypothetical protein [Sulfurimonas sp.]
MRFVFVLLLVLLSGCSDNSIVKIYDNSISDKKITCMRLVVFPPNEMIEITLKNKFTFEDSCDLRLEVFTKGNIHCNSNQNSQTKALGSMPSSYLRMKITKDNKTLYSYYIDIKDEIKDTHIKAGFSKMQKDLIIVR